MRLSAPVAHDAGGKEIRGLVRSDFTPSQKIDDMPLGHIMLGPSGGKGYPVDDPASTKNVLTVRDTPESPRQSIARSIIPTPITVGPDDEILKAATVMIEKNIRRLPVVDGDAGSPRMRSGAT